MLARSKTLSQVFSRILKLQSNYLILVYLKINLKVRNSNCYLKYLLHLSLFQNNNLIEVSKNVSKRKQTTCPSESNIKITLSTESRFLNEKINALFYCSFLAGKAKQNLNITIFLNISEM